jgi:hypothetical protein
MLFERGGHFLHERELIVGSEVDHKTPIKIVDSGVRLSETDPNVNKQQEIDVIKIEFPSDNTRLAGLIGRALVDYAGGQMQQIELPLIPVAEPVQVNAETVQEVAPSEQAIAETESEEAIASALDRHGVAFNEQFCGKAAEPFYTTGPREGQWKKRKGADDAAYDAWYASQRAPAAAAPVAEFDASAAFGGASAEAPPQNAPADGAGFMVWTSEMLAAGRLKQADINQAWQDLHLTPQLVFPPTAPEDVARNVGNLYAALSAVAGV